jgi:hypothetical protein
MALAPHTLQNIPDCLSRERIKLLRAASITAETNKGYGRRNFGLRMRCALTF